MLCKNVRDRPKQVVLQCTLEPLSVQSLDSLTSVSRHPSFSFLSISLFRLPSRWKSSEEGTSTIPLFLTLWKVELPSPMKVFFDIQLLFV